MPKCLQYNYFGEKYQRFSQIYENKKKRERAKKNVSGEMRRKTFPATGQAPAENVQIITTEQQI